VKGGEEVGWFVVTGGVVDRMRAELFAVVWAAVVVLVAGIRKITGVVESLVAIAGSLV
jgi:hypothetical protein